jgi:hypothetical protein
MYLFLCLLIYPILTLSWLALPAAIVLLGTICWMALSDESDRR